MSVVLTPFRILEEDAVVVGDWLSANREGDFDLLRTRLEHWDQSMDLAISRNVRLDGNRVRQKLFGGSDDAVELAVRVVLATGGAGRFGRISSIMFHEVFALTDEGQELEIEFNMVSAGLSQRLVLATEVLLAENRNMRIPGEPHVIGARLWGTTESFALEGQGSRFPVEVRSFCHDPVVKSWRVPWRLLWNRSDYHESFLTAVRLILNSDQPEFLAKVQQGDPILTKELLSAVICQLITAALADSSFGEDQYEPGSLGFVLEEWIAIATDGGDVDRARVMMNQDPGSFSASLCSIAAGVQNT